MLVFGGVNEDLLWTICVYEYVSWQDAPLEAGKNVSRNGVEKETICSGLRWRKVRVLMACALVFCSPNNV